MKQKNFMVFFMIAMLGIALICGCIKEQLITSEDKEQLITNKEEETAFIVSEEYLIYQDYLDVIEGVSRHFHKNIWDIGTIEATVISLRKDNVCPYNEEKCRIEPYPNDWGVVRIDKIISYTPYSEQTVEEGPIEEPTNEKEQSEDDYVMTTPEYKGKGLPEQKQKLPKYELVQEGQEVPTHFLLTARPVKVRYVLLNELGGGMESGEYPQKESGLESTQESEEQTTSHQVEPGKKVFKPIPKEPYLDEYRYIFTTKIGDFPKVIEKILPGLKVGDRFRAEIRYDGTLYIEEYDPNPCYYSNEIKQPNDCPDGGCKILIIVESEIYPLIQESLNIFSSDIENDIGYNIRIEKLSRKSNEQDVKNIIINEYGQGKLKGVFLIGNIPTARIYVGGWWPISLSDQSYYKDILNNRCEYIREYDAYTNCIIPSPFKPPFWVSRIIAPIGYEKEDYPEDWTDENILNYVKELYQTGYFLGQNKNNITEFSIPTVDVWSKKITLTSLDINRADLINNFFNHNHLYRTGQTQTIKELISYLPTGNESSSQYLIEKQLLFDNLINAGYKENEIHFLNSSVGENKEFLEYIQKPYEFAYVNAHGTSSWHQYDVNTQNLQNASPLILKFTSCSVGNFKDPNFIAGHYLTNGRIQFVAAASTPIWGITAIDFGYVKSLMQGKLIYEAWEFNPSAINWFGDPTLTMRQQKFIDREKGPKICVSRKSLEFGDITNESKILDFKIYNKGNTTLKLIPNYVLRNKWLFFNKNIPQTQSIDWVSFAGGTRKCPVQIVNGICDLENDGSHFEIERISIRPDDLNPGEYNGYFYIVSNDEDNPILKIPISFAISP